MFSLQLVQQICIQCNTKKWIGKMVNCPIVKTEDTCLEYPYNLYKIYMKSVKNMLEICLEQP